ncbi:head maturation protease, ClpP-related [Fusobacterium sp. THCT1E2]
MFLQASKKGNTLTIFIYGSIGQGWFSDVSADDVMRELNAYGNIEEININIHSPGGSVFEGCAIYNCLKRHTAKKKVYIDGLCASIATVIAMAGDEIIMSPVSSFMIHNPMAVMAGDAEELRDKADLLDTLKETIINAYVTKSKLSREAISTMMDNETWFKADEALKNGFITEVGSIGAGITNTALSFDLSIFNNVPKYLNVAKTTPDTENLNKTKEENEMDEINKMSAEEFKNKYPDMFKNIKNMGAEEERARIKELDTWANKTQGAEELIAEMKYKTLEKANAEKLLDYVTAGKKDPENKEDKKDDFIAQFEKKKEEYEASGAEELKGVEQINAEEKKAAADILDIVNMANNM